MQAREQKIDIDSFSRRHIGPNEDEVREMLREIGFAELEALIDTTVPKNIRLDRQLNLPEAKSESEALAELRGISKKNKVARSFIGAGYSDCITPPVIQRNILENPGWYTAYTPYQAEISQGRLEALLNFQTLVCDLTGLEIANASMLDEGTAAAEAMMMCHRLKDGDAAAHRSFFVDAACHPQTIDIVKTRAKPLGLEVTVGDWRSFKVEPGCFGVLFRGSVARLLGSAGLQHLGACRAFGIFQEAMLGNDESATQRDHHQDSQQAPEHGHQHHARDFKIQSQNHDRRHSHAHTERD